jgi:hypothetical protein
MPRKRALRFSEVSDQDMLESKEIASLATVTAGKEMFVKMVSREGETATVHFPPNLAGGLLKALKEALGDDPSRLEFTQVGLRARSGMEPQRKGD